ncbi:MAG: Rne/Rng family ribonuclease [Magnetococcales bacterium]|nr:Rne/Rng family ribonuclease [Magnetococcales bacterium]MBF0116564.1 Rne/Rng family ribonuclease [Magnetococcales bacterium]
MTKRMLVDATHAEEVRVAVVQDQRLIDLDIEAASREQIKGNVYLARVTRVEPSLQAAFVEFHGGRQGFLSINDIHSKYYPPEEPERENKAPSPELPAATPDAPVSEEGENNGKPAEDEEISDELPPADEFRPRHRRRHIPIQRLLTRGQTLLVQVVKEARSNKGASLTTHISLAGRYTVLLPENSGGGGISRKITDSTERKHLKEVLTSMEIPNHISLIIRTAGLGRTKREIARDMSYLLRLWKSIEEKAAQLKPPALIHEEGDLIIRAIRDLYTTDMEEILIDGQEGYRIGKDFMRLLMPRYVKVVQPYKDSLPLFARYQIENQIESMHERKVPLRAGGYLVIDPTEALVSIDINSGRSTRERDVESTAFKTNIQAAEEIARQLRMRDLGGLIVIDFIDMDDKKHVLEVEKHLKESLKQDRAKIQVGKISAFGLLELSRQRMKPTFNEANRLECPRCKGLGTIRSVDSASIHLFRQLEEEVAKGRYSRLTYTTSLEMANYLLNNKREQIRNMEATHDTVILIFGDPSLQTPEFHKNRVERSPEEMEARQAMQARHAILKEEADESEEIVDDLDDLDDDPDEEEIGPAKPQEKPAVAAPVSDASGDKTAARPEAEGADKNRRRRRKRKRPGTTVSAAMGEPLDLLGTLDVEQLPADPVQPPRSQPPQRRNNPPRAPQRTVDGTANGLESGQSLDPSLKNGPEEAVRVTQVPGLYVLGGSTSGTETVEQAEVGADETDGVAARTEVEGAPSTARRRRRRRRRPSQSRTQAMTAQTQALEESENNADEGSDEEDVSPSEPELVLNATLPDSAPPVLDDLSAHEPDVVIPAATLLAEAQDAASAVTVVEAETPAAAGTVAIDEPFALPPMVALAECSLPFEETNHAVGVVSVEADGQDALPEEHAIQVAAPLQEESLAVPEQTLPTEAVDAAVGTEVPDSAISSAETVTELPKPEESLAVVQPEQLEPGTAEPEAPKGRVRSSRPRTTRSRKVAESEVTPAATTEKKPRAPRRRSSKTSTEATETATPTEIAAPTTQES